jgi:hypothetical protein
VDTKTSEAEQDQLTAPREGRDKMPTVPDDGSSSTRVAAQPVANQSKGGRTVSQQLKTHLMKVIENPATSEKAGERATKDLLTLLAIEGGKRDVRRTFLARMRATKFGKEEIEKRKKRARYNEPANQRPKEEYAPPKPDPGPPGENPLGV